MSDQDLLLESLRGIQADIRESRGGMARVHERIDALQQTITERMDAMQTAMGSRIDVLQQTVVAQQIAIGRLRVKAGVWGLAAGVIPAIGAALWMFFK